MFPTSSMDLGMDFITYPPVSHQIDRPPSALIQISTMLENNDDSFRQNIADRHIKFANQLSLSRLLSLCSDYMGATPQETYTLVSARLDVLYNAMGVVYLAPRSSLFPIIGTRDIAAHVTQKVTFQQGRISDMEACKPLVLINHRYTDLYPSCYMDIREGGFGIWHIDLPLLAAYHHQLSDGVPMVDETLKNVVFMKNSAAFTKIALANALPTWLAGDDLDKQDSRGAGAMMDVVSLGNRNKKVWQSYYASFKNVRVSDLAHSSIAGTLSFTAQTAHIKDWYAEQLMWVNAYTELCYYARLKEIDQICKLGVSFDFTDKVISKFLTPNKIRSLVNYVPDELKMNVESTLLN